MDLKRITLTIFYVLVGIFIVLVSYFVTPVPKQTLFPFVAVLAIVFCILGAILIFLTLKLKVEKKLKIFLILTGVAAAGILISVILHNLIYGLFIVLFGEGFWKGGDEPAFFILAIFILPILFLIGAIGTIVLLIKKRKRKL